MQQRPGRDCTGRGEHESIEGGRLQHVARQVFTLRQRGQLAVHVGVVDGDLFRARRERQFFQQFLHHRVQTTGADVFHLLVHLPGNLGHAANTGVSKGQLGAFAADGSLAGEDTIFRGIVDVIEPEDSGTTCKLAVKIEGRFADLGRARERRWTDEEQKLDWPNDRFFEFQAALADREVQWGPNAAAPPQPPKKGFFERLFG